MLERLELENVGPAPEMVLDLHPRMNLMTGENGLGKSFLLDVAWWALTRRWPRDLNPRLTSGYPARPTDNTQPAKLRFELTTDAGNSRRFESTYQPRTRAGRDSPGGHGALGWSSTLTRTAASRSGTRRETTGGKRGNIDIQDRLPGYVFSPQGVWDGLVASVEGRSIKVCKGLLDDWSSWIRAGGTTRVAWRTSSAHWL